jgi:hypothetical protein
VFLKRLLAAKTASTSGMSMVVVLASVEVKVMDSISGRLAALVGNDMSVSLVDGTRIDHCQLVSFSRRLTTAWIVHDGDDVFVPVEAITEVSDVVRAA